MIVPGRGLLLILPLNSALPGCGTSLGVRVGMHTKEADLFWGECLNRNKNVAHLCRECHCPTDKSDNHSANCKAKAQHQIASLVSQKDKK